MSTTLSTPSANNAKIRWQEPYVSDGLNAKMNGIIPAGVVRGGRLETGGAALLLFLRADPTTGDSVYSYIDANGRQLTFKQTGDVTLDLAAVAGTTIYIGLEIVYAVSNPTLVYWRAYSQAEIDANPALVVLGKVVVPGVGPIPSANVTPTERRSAWASTSPQMRSWRQFAKNGSFDVAKVGAITPFTDADPVPGWDTYTGCIATNISWSIAQTAPRSGDNELRLALTGAGAQSGSFYQAGQGRVRAGEYVHASVWIRASVVAPGPAGYLGIGITFYDGDYNWVANRYISDLTIVGTMSYTEVDGIVQAPTNAEYAEFFIYFDDSGASSTGSYYFDDFRVWIERDWPKEDDLGENEPFTSGEKTYALDIVTAPPISSLADLVDFMWRLRSRGMAGGVHELLAGCRDGTTPFDLDLLHGGLKVDRRIENLGDDLIGSIANCKIPRIESPFPSYVTTTAHTLLWQMTAPDVTPRNIRLYVSHGCSIPSGSIIRGLFITINAYWDEALAAPDRWVADAPASASVLYALSEGGFTGVRRPGGAASPWSEADWMDHTFAYPFGCFPLDIGNRVDGEINDFQMLIRNPTSHTNPAPSSYTENMLCAKAIVKSFGRIYTTHPTPTVDGDACFNITTAGGNAPSYQAANQLRVYFDVAFTLTDQNCIVASIGTNVLGDVVNVRALDQYMDFWVYDSAGLAVDIQASEFRNIHWAVFGTYDF